MSVAFEDPLYLEAVYAALFALLQTSPLPSGMAFKLSQRVSIVPETIPVGSMPALLLMPGPIQAEQKNFSLTRWMFTAVAVVYLRGEAQPINQIPLSSTLVNWVLWGIASVFQTKPPYQKQTLGGLVYHCWIEGEIFPETQDQQIVLTIPIRMLAGNV
jgi:hypothetical protein